jgi:hypothetical protein
MKPKRFIQLTVLFILFILPITAFSGEWSSMTSGTGISINGVWGSSGSDVFAVVFDSTVYPYSCKILHYDGSTWSSMYWNDNEGLFGVWGSSGNDVFFVGFFIDDYYMPNAMYLYYLIVHYSDLGWSIIYSGPGSICFIYLKGVWGSSGSDVFAVGQYNTILHYNGSAWSSMTSGTTNGLKGVWGSSGSDVFAVGNSGTILHYNGSAWSSMASGTTTNLYGVWGSSGSDVFAVGYSGTILHYNGSAWSSMASGTTTNLYGVWGSSGSDVFAVGNSGTILHYNGSAWSSMTSGATTNLNGVWGSSGSDVFAVGDGGTILHYTESTLITLSAFTATPDDWEIILDWKTESEVNNAGFNIYRSKSEDGEYIKINDSLIPAEGSPTEGASYEFADKEVKLWKSYYYKLEDIDLNGTSTMHGPVSATPRLLYGLFQ